MNRPRRLAYVDALRVGAFTALVPFHAAIPFVPGGLPLIQNDTTSTTLTLFVAWLHEFRLPLLFLVAGMSVALSLERRDRRAIVLERARRLLVPLIFGVFVLVPPTVYIEKHFIGALDNGFVSFYVDLWGSGLYPHGNLSWHHYWFLAYLFVITLAALPCLERLPLRIEWRALGHPLVPVLPAVPLLLAEIALRKHASGLPDFIHDGAHLLQWLVILACGALVVRARTLRERIAAQRKVHLACAVDLSVLLGLWFWLEGARIDMRTLSALEFTLLAMLRVLHTWCWLLALTGLALAHCHRPRGWVTRLNGAVYPLYCLHLPIGVAVGAWVVGHDWPIAVEFCIIAGGSVFGSQGLYLVMIKRSRVLRLCFGLRVSTPARGRFRAICRSIALLGLACVLVAVNGCSRDRLHRIAYETVQNAEQYRCERRAEQRCPPRVRFETYQERRAELIRTPEMASKPGSRSGNEETDQSIEELVP